MTATTTKSDTGMDEAALAGLDAAIQADIHRKHRGPCRLTPRSTRTAIGSALRLAAAAG